MIRPGRFCFLGAAALLVCFGGQAPLALPATAAADQQHVRQLMVKYRAARLDLKRRVQAIKDLVAAGPEGTAAIKEVIEKDLARFEASVPDGPNTKAYDEKIEELRKTLAELRHDPDLTHEKTEKIGLPALDQLTELWKQREAVTAVHFQKLAKTAAQIEQLDALLAQLHDDWKDLPDGGPLPVAEMRRQTAALLAKATPHSDEAVRQVYAANAKMATEMPSDLVSGMNAVNAMRVMCGLRPLVYDPKLCEAAADHSHDMESRNFFAHDSPVPGKKTPWDRAKRFGTTASGENIYMGSSVSLDAIKAWFLSPGHHKNMLGEGHHRQGLGKSGKYWTQEFGS